LNKQIQLGYIIENVLSTTSTSASGSKRWMEISLNDLNAKLWSWHDSLSSDQRWDRWGSRFDAVHPSVAALQ
jgi:hypothetical protein